MLVRLSLSLFALLAVAGCGGSPGEGEKKLAKKGIQISDVPAELMEVAKKRLPDVDFADAWKNVDAAGKLHSYEIRGKNSTGKIREVRVGLDKKILEEE